MRQILGLVGVIALLTACATVPKPKELLDLEQLREGKQYRDAQEKQGDLIVASDEHYQKALEAWKGEELDQAKHWAILSWIKVQTALKIIAQEVARQRIAAAKEELKKAKELHTDMLAKNKEADEQLRLHGELAAAKKAAAEKEAKLKEQLTEAQRKQEEEKQLAEAQQTVDAAQLALKGADTVEASKYAKEIYAVAQALLVKARVALKAKKSSEATTLATSAKAKAEAAAQAARPHYKNARKAAERDARNQALQKDAAGVAGVTVRMKSLGQTQQLILPVPNLFKRSKTSPRAEKVGILNSIGELLKKYPEYPVVINGYTSYQVRRSQRYVVSQARAQAVANHFSTMGTPLKRFGVAGKGAEDLIARKYAAINNRVEIIILFQ